MKFKALVTSLLLASSSVALADDFSGSYNSYPQDASVRDHRWDDQRGDRFRPRWTPISQMITASRRNVITIDERSDELRAIRLQNGSGATYVYSIQLRYEDGRRENITVGKWLYAGVPELTFDVAQSRELDRVVINTWTSVSSTYQVLGQRARRIERPPVVQPPAPMPPMPPVSTLPAYGLVVGKDLTFASTAGYVHLPVGAEKGNFSKLRIEAGGTMGPVIGRVYVTFATGQHQMFDLNKSLYRGEVLNLDLTGSTHQIIAVTVMAGNDVRAIDQRTAWFSLTLL